jgi:hypothetical protein
VRFATKAYRLIPPLVINDEQSVLAAIAEQRRFSALLKMLRAGLT